ncbi:MAG: diaminopimelate epimerase [Coriobacteriaceae bacterium]|nr:diaminopimelate epimerase [Coriobacteriaceae bacterium]
MRFTKMQGIGNDYVYVNCFEEVVDNPASLAQLVSDRHFGIGSDGLILIRPSARADFFMEMFNADGSRSEMCGNGIRCVGKYVFDHGLTDKTEVDVNTLAGVKHLALHVEGGVVASVTVDMGEPVLDSAHIPVVAGGGHAVGEPIEVAGRRFAMTCVSMGNPHAVVFVDETAGFPVEEIGQPFEFHPAFPRRVNAEFVQVLNRSEVNMRVWERGTGETLACGTGACATAVACILNGLTENEVTVHLLGGDLVVRWNRVLNRVFMTGPATTVFEGEMDVGACGEDVPPHKVDPDW